jgi:hypothetical protein
MPDSPNFDSGYGWRREMVPVERANWGTPPAWSMRQEYFFHLNPNLKQTTIRVFCPTAKASEAIRTIRSI